MRVPQPGDTAEFAVWRDYRIIVRILLQIRWGFRFIRSDFNCLICHFLSVVFLFPRYVIGTLETESLFFIMPHVGGIPSCLESDFQWVGNPNSLILVKEGI